MKRLFYHGYSKNVFHIAMLLLRVGFGVLMIPGHGWKKLTNFAGMKGEFMNFMGLGSTLSLGLATFAEFFCSLLLIFGLFTRLATIPLIITMVVAFGVHNYELFSKYDLIPAFLLGYITILLLGPGKYSMDALVSKK